MTKSPRSSWLALLVAGAVVASMAASCSSSSRNDIKKTATDLRSDVSSGANQLGARATAEAIRASLKANKDADKKGVRSVEVLNQVVKNLPGNPKVTGIEDKNGDGLDDDGFVQVDQDGQSACVTLPPRGKDIKVTSGACGS